MQPSWFDDPELADRLCEATGGRPDLLSLAAEMIAGHGVPDGPLAVVLAQPAGPIMKAVCQSLPSDLFLVPVNAGEYLTMTPDLCEILGHRDGEEAMRRLREAGALVGQRVIPVVVHAARAVLDPDPDTIAAAGRWLEEQGRIVEAVHAFTGAGREGEVVRLLDAHGETVLASGHATLVIDALSALPRRTRAQHLLLGDALRVNGSVMKASHAYAVVADAEPVWDAGLAWRVGIIHYHRGNSLEALRAFERASVPGSSARDEALLLAWKADAHLRLGEVEAAVKIARESVDRARISDSATVLATAYVSLAVCLTMTGETIERDELYGEALQIATATGDVILQARILTNQTYQLLHEGRYERARDAAQRAGQVAIAASHANMRWMALCNEGGALTMLGRFDEAISRLELALAFARRMGSRRTTAVQIGLGEVYRRRGWPEQARAAYETAIRLADESGNAQHRIVALAGLARVLAATGDLTAARDAADEAVEHATAKVQAVALLARGWVALFAREEGALELADEAAAAARAGGEQDSLAEALELRAAAESEPRRAQALLREALALWEAAGAEVEAARVACRLGELPGADTDERLAALLGAQTLARAGASVGEALHTGSTVTIKAFGRFEVSVDGQAVPAALWQSRKARDLLRILVARRGRPVPRPELCELLWPDDDPARTGHRLSVLLSIVRGVLDPHRTVAADCYLVADQAGIALDITRIGIDVEEFLSDARHGGRLAERGQPEQARALLESAAQRYHAEVFEDEPYFDWGDPLREEARATYIATVRRLAALDGGGCVDWLLRLLAIDPYDEEAHRALINGFAAAGQHGEARRALDRYRRAMATLGVSVPDQYHSPT